MNSIFSGALVVALALTFAGCTSDVGEMPPSLGANLPSSLVRSYKESDAKIAAKKSFDLLMVLWRDASIARNTEGFHAEEFGGLVFGLLECDYEEADYDRLGKLKEHGYVKRYGLGLVSSRKSWRNPGKDFESASSFHVFAGSFGEGRRRDGSEYLTFLWVPITTHTPEPVK